MGKNAVGNSSSVDSGKNLPPFGKYEQARKGIHHCLLHPVIRVVLPLQTLALRQAAHVHTAAPTFLKAPWASVQRRCSGSEQLVTALKRLPRWLGTAHTPHRLRLASILAAL